MGWVIYGVGIAALFAVVFALNDADWKIRNIAYPLLIIWAIGGAAILSDGKGGDDDCQSYGSFAGSC